MSYPYKRPGPAEVTIRSAQFIAGATALDNLPLSALPEVAIVGRSNAGKSTLLNRLAQSKKLARTSATPGRTQQLNVFQLTVFEPKSKQEHRLNLVDLPGFGYAKFSKAQREKLNLLMIDYITSREPLRVVCLVLDCRRDPGPDEMAIRDITYDSARHLLLIATKLDTLRKNERPKRVAALAWAFSLASASDPSIVLAGEDISAALIWQRIFLLLSKSFEETGKHENVPLTK